MYEQLLEPLKYYDTVGKKQHEDNTNEYFDALFQKSGVNAEENRSTVKNYKKEDALAKKLGKKLFWLNILRIFLIVASVIGGILFIVSLTQFSTSTESAVILLIVGLVMLIAGILITVLLLSPHIKTLKKMREEHAKKAEELLALAKAQTAPLNALFTESDTIRIIEKTVPGLEFERNFSSAQETFLKEKHDFLDLNNEESTMLNTLSGKLFGNPFIFCERLMHRIVDHVYHGTLVISWTETYRDSKGNTRTRRRTQTLHASVIKPKPEYKKHNFLGYGCQAAPDLTFERNPTDVEKMNEKQIARFVRKRAKKLRKKSEKATKKGGNFQEMANTDFDVIFGAIDRDNEVQFRLMYTPLAQRNTLDLMKSKTNFGDDFRFIKHKRFNIIDSEHAQRWSIDTSPTHYYSYDIDEIKKNFVLFNTAYFKSVFFDFAPLISVPAYLEEPCASLEVPDGVRCSYSSYEHEVMANAIGSKHFAHEDSDTPAILKTLALGKMGENDNVTVTAHSYNAINRVDLIPVLGGDGRFHPVPVPWVEYIPLTKVTNMSVCGGENPGADAIGFHGLWGKIQKG